MCGIAGIVAFNPQSEVSRSELTAMRDAIAHRGPDGAGILVDQNVGFGHRRLSIIDVQGGAQPMANTDQSIWVTYNGEIYNYPALRKDLELQGHKFRTSCDTEVILHLYEKYGEAFPAQLNGIFALALWDKTRGRVLLCRDRLGIKPLFYHVSQDRVRFASEMKSLLVCPSVSPEMDPARLGEYLIFRAVHGENTLIKGIKRVRPGSVLIVDASGIRANTYWSLPEPSADATENPSEKIEGLLQSSVEMQLMSDVPLGAFCSGGIDSSLIATLAANAKPDGLDAFTIGYSMAEWDERRYAREVVRSVNARGHEIEVDESMYVSALGDARDAFDEPLSHPSSIPLLLISRMAQKHVKVVLSGEGADELFAGYPRHRIIDLHARLLGLSNPVRRGMGKCLSIVPFRKVNMLGRALEMTMRKAIVFNAAFSSESTVQSLLSPDLGSIDIAARYADLDESLAKSAPLEALTRHETKTYLAIALDRLDRMSMSAGIEARVPFLDHRIVEAAVATPTKDKLSWHETKKVVRRIARNHLPVSVVERSKVGFGVPISDWLRNDGPLASEVADVRNSSLLTEGWLQPKELDRLIVEHSSNKANHAEIIWLIVNLAHWYDHIRNLRSSLHPSSGIASSLLT